MPTGRNGPALWDALLDAVRPHTERDIVVTGGCLRDFALGLEPKDIDLCINISDRDELEQLGDKLSKAGMFDVHLIELGHEAEYDEAFKGDLVGVLEGEAMGLPVNIIARAAHADGRDALLDSFDFNILKSWYDGLAYTSPVAADDMAARTATLAHQRHTAQSRDRFERFAARNPGVLTFVDPWQLDFDFDRQ